MAAGTLGTGPIEPRRPYGYPLHSMKAPIGGFIRSAQSEKYNVTENQNRHESENNNEDVST